MLNSEMKMLYAQYEWRRRRAMIRMHNVCFKFTAVGADGVKKDIEAVDYQQLKETIFKYKFTVYDQRTNTIFSLGKDAYKNLKTYPDPSGSGEERKFEYIDISNCWYIGERAFYGCDNMKVISFANKTDIDIPVLENVNAFFNSDGNPNTDITIVVPDGLYHNWINSVNWAAYKDQIKKVSEYGN